MILITDDLVLVVILHVISFWLVGFNTKGNVKVITFIFIFAVGFVHLILFSAM